MKIVILVAGALFATHTLAAELELSDILLDAVSAGGSRACDGSCVPHSLLPGTLLPFPSRVEVREQPVFTPITNSASTAAGAALKVLFGNSSSWQGTHENPATIDHLAQPQRSATHALQLLLSAQ